MRIHYDGRTFRSVQNTDNGDVSGETIFNYYQRGHIVWADYAGGTIVQGSLIATVDENGQLNMRYHHINISNELMTGKCRSIPELLANGKLRLHEEWQWTCKDGSTGRSVVEEI